MKEFDTLKLSRPLCRSPPSHVAASHGGSGEPPPNLPSAGIRAAAPSPGFPPAISGQRSDSQNSTRALSLAQSCQTLRSPRRSSRVLRPSSCLPSKTLKPPSWEQLLSDYEEAERNLQEAQRRRLEIEAQQSSHREIGAGFAPADVFVTDSGKALDFMTPAALEDKIQPKTMRFQSIRSCSRCRGYGHDEIECPTPLNFFIDGENDELRPHSAADESGPQEQDPDNDETTGTNPTESANHGVEFSGQISGLPSLCNSAGAFNEVTCDFHQSFAHGKPRLNCMENNLRCLLYELGIRLLSYDYGDPHVSKLIGLRTVDVLCDKLIVKSDCVEWSEMELRLLLYDVCKRCVSELILWPGCCVKTMCLVNLEVCRVAYQYFPPPAFGFYYPLKSIRGLMGEADNPVFDNGIVFGIVHHEDTLLEKIPDALGLEFPCPESSFSPIRNSVEAFTEVKHVLSLNFMASKISLSFALYEPVIECVSWNGVGLRLLLYDDCLSRVPCDLNPQMFDGSFLPCVMFAHCVAWNEIEYRLLLLDVYWKRMSELRDASDPGFGMHKTTLGLVNHHLSSELSKLDCDCVLNDKVGLRLLMYNPCKNLACKLMTWHACCFELVVSIRNGVYNSALEFLNVSEMSSCVSNVFAFDFSCSTCLFGSLLAVLFLNGVKFGQGCCMELPREISSGILIHSDCLAKPELEYAIILGRLSLKLLSRESSLCITAMDPLDASEFGYGLCLDGVEFGLLSFACILQVVLLYELISTLKLPTLNLAPNCFKLSFGLSKLMSTTDHSKFLICGGIHVSNLQPADACLCERGGFEKVRLTYPSYNLGPDYSLGLVLRFGYPVYGDLFVWPASCGLSISDGIIFHECHPINVELALLFDYLIVKVDNYVSPNFSGNYCYVCLPVEIGLFLLLYDCLGFCVELNLACGAMMRIRVLSMISWSCGLENCKQLVYQYSGKFS